ncbi:MFS transporter [Streptomyces sp. NPDC057623]|uniref:MFS transporter n=1 Tax=Streptomyces sp. NPDC057623 TaxID=3346187 RepID=UPI0036CB60E7
MPARSSPARPARRRTSRPWSTWPPSSPTRARVPWRTPPASPAPRWGRTPPSPSSTRASRSCASCPSTTRTSSPATCPPRPPLLIGSALFGLISTAAAFAGSPGELIAARALLGVSAAVIMPSTLSILRNVFADQRELAMAIAVWSAVGAAGAAAGPIAGGLLVEHLGWQAAFWSAAPVIALCLPLVAALVPESHGYREGRWDVLSALLSLGGIFCVVYAIKDTEHGVSSTTLTALAVGVTLLSVFVHRQRRLAHPLLDLTLFADRRFVIGAMCVLLGMFAQFGPMFFLSQRFQLIQGFGPMTTGLALVPMMLAALLATTVTTRLMPRIGLRSTLVTGFGTAVVGLLR